MDIKEEDLYEGQTVEMNNDFGIEYVYYASLREQFPNSYFFPDVYDGAIIGVDIATESIIYEWMHIGYLWVLHCEGSYAGFKDRVYGGSKMILWAQRLSEEDLQGQVRPSVMMANRDISEWDQKWFWQKTDEIQNKIEQEKRSNSQNG